jgi:methylase of polypeptide subunit release factors
LEVSKINLEKHNLLYKVSQLESDLLSVFLEKENTLEKNLIITANLPYIKNEDLDNMDN